MNDHLDAGSHAIAAIRGLTHEERRSLISWAGEPAGEDVTARLMHACALDARAMFPDDAVPAAVPSGADDTDYTTDPDGRI